MISRRELTSQYGQVIKECEKLKAERDRLRAENERLKTGDISEAYNCGEEKICALLKAANERNDRLRAELDSERKLTEHLRGERDRVQADRNAAWSEFSLISKSFTVASEQRDAAQAEAAGLRVEIQWQLEAIDEGFLNEEGRFICTECHRAAHDDQNLIIHSDECCSGRMRAAIPRTPDQHRDRIVAAGLREANEEIDKRRDTHIMTFGTYTATDAQEVIKGIIERLEKGRGMAEPIFVNDQDDIIGRIHYHRDATIADLERRLAKQFEAADRRLDQLIKVRRKLAEVTEILNLQRPRIEAAVAMWRAAHPGQEIATPDLGRLLEWLMEGRRDGERYRALYEMAGVSISGFITFRPLLLPDAAKWDGVTAIWNRSIFDAAVDAERMES